MIVELISVGTEILLGNITNTNAQYLSEECAVLGLNNYYQVTVGDNEERLSETLKMALQRSDLVILSGGLGPTEDDLTRETTAKVLGRSLYEDEKIRQAIEDYFEKMHMVPSDNNWRQAMVIEGAQVIPNDNGTAPGMIVETEEKKRIILLPGPPEELKPMFKMHVAPYLASLNAQVIYSKTVKLCGVGESRAAEILSDLIDGQTNPTIATYAKGGEVHVRITVRDEDMKAAKRRIKPMIQEVKNRFGDKIYSTRSRESLEERIVGLLKRKNMTLTTAESCTGGLIAGTLINVAGASEIFNEGYVTYSNEAKHRILGVRKRTLKNDGAVSEACAAEMAKGAAKAANTRAAIAVTGIAGPGGGTEEKPVGLVYIACCIDGNVWVEEHHLNGNRQKIRSITVKRALDLLRRCMEK